MRVLITAGTVYGKLDDNKLVGNRIRGIWATKFASYLADRGHDILLLVPDTLAPELLPRHGRITVRYHDGYASYAEKCYAEASNVDAAVMAAAVVNWIPKEPFKGKMPTDGFEEGAEQLIPFVLAPRVIDRMRKLNPKLTLIGCKMTSGAQLSDTVKAAYKTLIKSHANVVVANDLSRLKHKVLVYPDGNAYSPGLDEYNPEFGPPDEFAFKRLYEDLEKVLLDRHYSTLEEPAPFFTHEESARTYEVAKAEAAARFDELCNRYRERFVKRPDGPDGPEMVFGAVAVRINLFDTLVSPREKNRLFTSADAVIVRGIDTEELTVTTSKGKATLNAPLLLRAMDMADSDAVVHLHEEIEGLPSAPYAPPGTARDNNRLMPEHFEKGFNIEGHGCFLLQLQP